MKIVQLMKLFFFKFDMPMYLFSFSRYAMEVGVLILKFPSFPWNLILYHSCSRLVLFGFNKVTELNFVTGVLMKVLR